MRGKIILIWALAFSFGQAMAQSDGGADRLLAPIKGQADQTMNDLKEFLSHLKNTLNADLRLKAFSPDNPNFKSEVEKALKEIAKTEEMIASGKYERVKVEAFIKETFSGSKSTLSKIY